MLPIWNDVHNIIHSVGFLIVLLDHKALGY